MFDIEERFREGHIIYLRHKNVSFLKEKKPKTTTEGIEIYANHGVVYASLALDDVCLINWIILTLLLYLLCFK